MTILDPEVQSVALGLAIRMEAVENVLAQVYRQRATPAISFVEGTAAALLGCSTFEGLEQAQVTQDLFQADLRTQEGKIDLGTRR